LATDQEVLGSTPSRRTKIGIIMKISLQKAVVYFFLIVFIILLILTVIL